MERLTLLMWRKPSLEKKHNATDVASEMLNIIEITRECIPEFSTFYIPASKKNGVKEAVLSKECIESLLHKSEHNTVLIDKTGYTLSLFTSLDSLCSCSFLLHIGSGHTRLTDSVLIKFPLCWNWQNSDVITRIEKLFMELVKLFCPYWGCVANLGLTNEKKYVVDEIPTTLHWLNFFSESALKKIGPKKLQAIHSIPNCRIIDSNIIKTSSYPTTTVEENASHNLARLNSILLR